MRPFRSFPVAKLLDLSLIVAGGTSFLPSFSIRKVDGIWNFHSMRWSRSVSISSLKMPVIVLETRDTKRSWTLYHIVKLV